MPLAQPSAVSRLWELTPPPQGSPHPVTGGHRAPCTASDNSEAPPQRQSPHSLNPGPTGVASRPSSSRSLSLFVPLPVSGSQHHPRLNLLHPLCISESASRGAQVAAALKINGVTFANRKHCIFPRLHNGCRDAVPYLGFP